MAINLKVPDMKELKPRITVVGVGGAGGNAVNNMINSGLKGVEFVVANTDAQALTMSSAERRIQMGTAITEGLGAGSKPEVGAAAAEEAIDDIKAQLAGSHMVFITAGMGGGTGTGAAPVIARASYEEKILTVGVVTKPFHFEGKRRMTTAEAGIKELQKYVDTLLVIPNQNLFRVATESTTFADAFALADQVLHSGVACITDLMVKEGLINLDFADVKTIMKGMGKAMMGTGEASGDKRAMEAAEAAISNPLLDDICMKGARGLLVSITGGNDMTLYEVDEAASRIREEVDTDANIIVGATFDDDLDGIIRVSVVAAGIEVQRGEGRDPVSKSDQSVSSLSKQLAQLAANQSVRDQNQKAGQAWKGPGDVTIEKRPPQHAARPAIGKDGKPVAPARPGFVPQPPEVARREARRIPGIEEFPEIVQREIRAKSGETASVGIKAQKKKLGFFERLTGKRRKEQEPEIKREKEPTMTAPKAEGKAPATPQSAPAVASGGAPNPSKMRLSRQAGTPRPKPVAPAAKEGHDDLEIPAFLKRQA